MKNNMTDKSKNNKKPRFLMSWLGVIVILAIIVANFIMWKDYFAEQSQIEVLENQVTAISEQTMLVPQPPTDLESQLQGAQADLAAALQAFPANIDRNDVVDFILDTANACQVQMIPLISDGWESETSGHLYYVLKYHGTVTGSLINTSNFITLLRNGDYPTMIITGCVVDRLTGVGADVLDDDIEVIVDLSIAIYTTSIQEIKDVAL